MNHKQKRHLLFGKIFFSILFAIFFLLTGSVVLSHGPKGHAEEFTALQAVKKGLSMYDRLIEHGKLDENWETDLNSIEVTKSLSETEKEFAVKFTISKGEKRSVFIFFSEKGEYKGSNFTGK